MNKKCIAICLLVFMILVLSCQTSESAGKTAVSDHSNNKTGTEEISPVPVLSKAEVFSESIKGISLSIVSAPQKTTAGLNFKSPYTVKVTDAENQTVPDYSLVVRYPEQNNNGTILFADQKVITGNDGVAVYTPETTSFACNSEISFFIDPKTDDSETKKIAENTKVSAQWKVRTNKARTGGLISLVDYNAKGNSLTETFSSSLLLKELLNNGFSNVGNFDIPRSKIEDKDAVYQYVNGMVGNSVSYLIYGKIQYVSPVEKKEDGTYSCTLQSAFKCMDMKTGSILYSNEISETASDAADWKVVGLARQKLAEKIGQLIIYNM